MMRSLLFCLGCSRFALNKLQLMIVESLNRVSLTSCSINQSCLSLLLMKQSLSRKWLSRSFLQQFSRWAGLVLLIGVSVSNSLNPFSESSFSSRDLLVGSVRVLVFSSSLDLTSIRWRIASLSVMYSLNKLMLMELRFIEERSLSSYVDRT